MTFSAALVGYGMAGQVFHGPQLRAVGAQVSDICVRSRDRVAQARRDFPAARIHPSLDQLLAQTTANVVVIATPNALHGEQAIAALRAGRPVVIDKPMAATWEQARQMLAVSQETGVGLTVYQNRRWDGQHLTLKAVLAAGTLGEVFRFERRYERFRPQPRDRWKENDAVAGGLLLDLGPHLVDNALELFGPVESVYAEARARTTAAVDDVFIALRHTGGVISHLQAGAVAGAPGPALRVLGNAGALVATTNNGEPSPFALVQPPPELDCFLAFGGARVRVEMIATDTTGFYRAVGAWLAGGPVPVDPHEGLATQQVLAAATRSARQGQVVRLVDNCE